MSTSDVLRQLKIWGNYIETPNLFCTKTFILPAPRNHKSGLKFKLFTILENNGGRAGLTTGKILCSANISETKQDYVCD
jgi:hypothetical protein